MQTFYLHQHLAWFPLQHIFSSFPGPKSLDPWKSMSSGKYSLPLCRPSQLMTVVGIASRVAPRAFSSYPSLTPRTSSHLCFTKPSRSPPAAPPAYVVPGILSWLQGEGTGLLGSSPPIRDLLGSWPAPDTQNDQRQPGV